MHHIQLLILTEGLQQLDSESADEPQTESLEVIVLDKLLQVYAE